MGFSFFGNKKKANKKRTEVKVEHHHHKPKERVKIVEKKVKRGRSGLGLAVGAGAKFGGGLVKFAKKGYDASKNPKNDPMSRDSPYGAPSKHKNRGDSMEKTQLGFPNDAITKRMKKTGFSFMIAFLFLAVMMSPGALAAAPSEDDCGYEEGDGEAVMLGCFIYFVYSVSLGMLIAHPLAILYVIIGVATILIFLAFGAIIGGAVMKATER